MYFWTAIVFYIFCPSKDSLKLRMHKFEDKLYLKLNDLYRIGWEKSRAASARALGSTLCTFLMCLLRVPTVENWWWQKSQVVCPEWTLRWLEKDSGWWNTLEQISQTNSEGMSSKQNPINMETCWEHENMTVLYLDNSLLFKTNHFTMSLCSFLMCLLRLLTVASCFWQ